MQEEVEGRTVSLAVNTTKMTGRVLKEAITRYMNAQRSRQRTQPEKEQPKTGHVSMRELQKQYGELRSVELDDTSTRRFDRFARKYHVQYKVFRLEKGKYQLWFKAPNDAAMQSAFSEYMADKINRSSRPSMLEMLRKLREQMVNLVPRREKHRELEL